MSVNERMICHAIIGRNPHKERIMTVDISARFIAPLLEFSSQELLFQLYQVGVQPYLHVHHTYTFKKLCSSQMSCSCTMSRCNDIYYSVCINSCFCEFITVLFVLLFFSLQVANWSNIHRSWEFEIFLLCQSLQWFHAHIHFQL